MGPRILSSLATLLATCVLALGLATTANATGDRDKECAKVKAQIRQLEARMRRGYSAAQGVKFDARMRELKEKRYFVCR